MLYFFEHATDILMMECLDIQGVILKQFQKINVQKASGCRGEKIIFQL